MNNSGIIIVLKLCYLLLAWGLLGIIYWSAPKPGVDRFQEKQFRTMMIYRTINALLIIGYAFLEVKWPLWLELAQTRGLLRAYLLGDLVNFSLLIWYLMGMLYLNFRFDQKTRWIGSGFGSYLMQYGYFWLFIINIFVILRLDYYYLPLVPPNLPAVYRWALEGGALALMVGLQLLVLWLRRSKMIPADPEIERLVRKVAGEFKVRVKKVRIWQLERVLNAFATGIFLKNIYLTESLVNSLSLDDLRMIVGHECAHFKRRHLELRAAVIAGLFFLGSSLAEDYPDLPLSIYILYWVGAVLAYNLYARFQEFEADRIAALKLGDGTRMAEALARLGSSVNFGRIFKWLVGHPDMEARVKRLGIVKRKI